RWRWRPARQRTSGDPGADRGSGAAGQGDRRQHPAQRWRSGGGAQVRLRGVSSINGEAEPLFVVDGMIVSNVAIPSGIFAVTKSNLGGNGSIMQDSPVSRIADLNPEDIESVEVLKGAAAAAIYGS